MSVDIEAPASEIFAQLVHRDLVDSVIVYNEIGQVRYPNAPTPLEGGDHDRSEAWLDAERLEFARKDLAAAAEAWEAIATASADLRKVTQALRAQARCLAGAGQRQAALDVLIGTLASPEFRHVTDQTGNLITPNAQLHALKLLDDSASDTFRVTLNRLVDFVNDYTDSGLSGSQRLFLMQQLQAIAPGDVDFPTMDAEALAARLACGTEAGIRRDALTGKESLAAHIVGGIPESGATIADGLKHLQLVWIRIKPKSVRFHGVMVAHRTMEYYTKVQYGID